MFCGGVTTISSSRSEDESIFEVGLADEVRLPVYEQSRCEISEEGAAKKASLQ
jgi:hypothetical protein